MFQKERKKERKKERERKEKVLKKDLSSDRLYNGQEKHFSRMLNGFTGPCLYLNLFFFFFLSGGIS